MEYVACISRCHGERKSQYKQPVAVDKTISTDVTATTWPRRSRLFLTMLITYTVQYSIIVVRDDVYSWMDATRGDPPHFYLLQRLARGVCDD